MAVIPQEQIGFMFGDGNCSKSVLLAFRNVTAGDTADLAPWLKVIKRVGMVSDTGTHIAAVPFAGTIVTIPAGPSSDGVWILAVGVSA